MQGRLTRTMLIAAVAMLYVLVALPLPYLLIDHYSAIQAGDTNHSDVDIHAWLEWAAGSSLSESPPPLPSSLAPLPASPIPSIVVRAVLPDLASHLRGPPALA
ncbi:MAG: hypothetical protein NNA30_00365 [Nitrospira sp.]|nr:hypothetical protein [Nitrospira sp.]